MTDKPKRKNDEHIPRRYWWIFGILAFVLFVTLPFPISVIENPQSTLYGYGLWSIVSFVGLSLFASHYGIRRKITALLFAVMLLFVMHTFSAFGISLRDGIGEQECISDSEPVFRTYDCFVEYFYDEHYHIMYMTIGDLPVGIKTLDKQVDYQMIEERFSLENRYP